MWLLWMLSLPDFSISVVAACSLVKTARNISISFPEDPATLMLWEGGGALLILVICEMSFLKALHSPTVFSTSSLDFWIDQSKRIDKMKTAGSVFLDRLHGAKHIHHHWFLKVKLDFCKNIQPSGLGSTFSGEYLPMSFSLDSQFHHSKKHLMFSLIMSFWFCFMKMHVSSRAFHMAFDLVCSIISEIEWFCTERWILGREGDRGREGEMATSNHAQC